MDLQKPITAALQQLADTISQLTDEQYTRPVCVLSNSTIGQHLRHVIEFFTELQRGYITGEVNYDARLRDREIETQRVTAIALLDKIGADLNKPDKTLYLSSSITNADAFRIESNYFRELLYNHEHTVHHMALIRIGVEAVSAVDLSENFGVAESTIQYRQACAQ